MANIKQTLENPLYTNWVKAGLVLKVTRDGIQCFVGDTVTIFLQKSLNDICARKHLPIGTVCNSCTTHNVLPCPTRGTCTIRHGACNYHDNSDPSKTYRPCPTGICGELQDIIYRNHRFRGPSWRNTKAQLWCSNSWEIAKCFMAADGYSTVTSAAKTDFPGLVSVVINLIDFQNVVANNLSRINNLFCKARRIRNEILHTSTFQLSVPELNGYIDTMIQLLNDPTHLATDGNAQAAIIKLNQIKNNSLAVTQEDECQLREEALKAIKDKTEEALEAIKDKTEEELKKLQTTGERIKDDIEVKGCQQVTLIQNKAEEKKTEVIQNLETRGEETIDAIDTKGDQQVTLIQDKADEKKTEVIQSMETKAEEIKDNMEAKKEEVLIDIGAMSTDYLKVFQKEAQEKIKDLKYLKSEDVQQKEKQSYTDDKQNLQSELINLYRDNYIKTSIYTQRPEEEDIGITDIYVEPNMEVVGLQQEQHGNTTVKTSVKSYKDIFYKDSHVSKNIYITGKAGMGKTAFCKALLSTWCRAHSKRRTYTSYNFEHSMLPTSLISNAVLPNDDEVPDTSADKVRKNVHSVNSDQTSLEDERVMLNFPFLFYISLRNAGDDSAIENMIKNQLLIDPMHKTLLNDILQKEPEKCLIVLDGLDEWSPPSNHRQDLPYVTKGLPARTAASKCTILTTTRPWKLEVLKLRPSEINQHVALLGLNEEAADKMIKRIVKILNGRRRGSKCERGFREELRRRNLSGLVIVPVMLKQLICLWHADKLLGNSQCDIYGGMLNLMFELAETKLEENVKREHQDAQHRLPRCFGNSKQCQEFTSLIYSLGRLAFESLMCRNEESALVFNSSEVEMNGLSAKDVDNCLKVGILSQSKVYSTELTRQKSLSFIHKSFQEFLAAVFVSMTYDSFSAQRVGTIVSKIHSLDNVFLLYDFLVFVSGMIPQMVNTISKHICEVTSYVAKDYRQNISFNNGSSSVRKLNGLMIRCVKESRENGSTDDIQLKLEDIVMDSAWLYDEGLFNPKELNGELLEDTSFNELLIYIMDINKSNIKSIYIDMALMSNISVERLCQLKSLKKIILQNVLNSNETIDHAPSRLVMNSKDTLVSLSLRHFSELPILHDLKCIQNLEINGFILSQETINCLMEYIKGTTQLQNIQIIRTKCNSREQRARQLDLSEHQQLRCLSISFVPFISSVKLNTSNLLECSIDVKLAGCLDHAQHLNHLSIDRDVFTHHSNTSKDTVSGEILAKILPTLPMLKYLHISNIDFGESELFLSPEMKNLENVRLEGCRMTSEALQRFVDSIPDTRNVVCVYYTFSILITPDGRAPQCAEYINSCTRFVVTCAIGESSESRIFITFHTVATDNQR